MARSGQRAVLAVVLLALLAAPALGATPRMLLQSAVQSLSGKAVVMGRRSAGRPSVRMLAIRVPNGRLVHIEAQDASQLAAIRSGMDVQATGTWQPPARSGTAATRFLATTIRAGSPAAASVLPKVQPSDKFLSAAGINIVLMSFNTPVARNISTLVIPIVGLTDAGSACPGSAQPKFTADAVRRAVFQDGAGSPTVSSFFSQCANKMAFLDASNSAVPDVVSLPCSGGGSSDADPAWRFSSCEVQDYAGWGKAAEAKLRSQGVPVDQYAYRVYLLPPGACGDLVQTATIGCDGTPGNECQAYIGGDYWTSPAVITQALGSNLHLGQAAAMRGDEVVDSGDATCVMGQCCSSRCPNLPHAWQLGWNAVDQIDATQLAPGTPFDLTLSPQSSSFSSGLRILPTWVEGLDPLFLSLRTRDSGGVEAGLPDDAAPRVHVHTSGITGSRDSHLPTVWRAGIEANTTWEMPEAGLVVRVQQSPRFAGMRISVCRKGGAETAASCAASLDNDCNGLVGDKDPACAAFQRPAASPSPQQPQPQAAAAAGAGAARVRRPPRFNVARNRG